MPSRLDRRSRVPTFRQWQALESAYGMTTTIVIKAGGTVTAGFDMGGWVNVYTFLKIESDKIYFE